MAYSIIVHGGAGEIDPASLPERLAGCRKAAEAGYAVLKRGGSAVDAAMAAVVVLEDDPLFNAGTGSTLNTLGRVETDAAIMDGASLRAGAIAAVSGIRNPVRLAHAVMVHTPHVLLTGEGALQVAREQGIELCDPESLIVASQRDHWRRKYGTVGAVALDAEGRLAAATSTGGMFDKLPGRIGDTPLIGCGTYADERAAVSCTGFGEDIIRTTLARSAAYLLQESADVASATDLAIRYFMDRTDSEAGLIMVDRKGQLGFARSTTHMPVCGLGSDGQIISEG
ncbi:MAG TPA: isoaspartyl peptidase/L-asparaginase family protein [Gammaproteobacteria bacterium]|jgi:beta-aspartyl-peptidase (threonine type)|nr:isoaspartyl peptidase/L-asparaginase family protein [Gammaproteobacteria bacterium]